MVTVCILASVLPKLILYKFGKCFSSSTLIDTNFYFNFISLLLHMKAGGSEVSSFTPHPDQTHFNNLSCLGR